MKKFIHNLLLLLENEKNTIRWSKDGRCIEITSDKNLLEAVLKKYFKTGLISSFIRQLNKYGFRKLKTMGIAYKHPKFIRSNLVIVDQIKAIRRKRKRRSAKANANSTNTLEQDFQDKLFVWLKHHNLKKVLVGYFGSEELLMELSEIFPNSDNFQINDYTNFFDIKTSDINDLQIFIVQNNKLFEYFIFLIKNNIGFKYQKPLIILKYSDEIVPIELKTIFKYDLPLIREAIHKVLFEALYSN